MAFNEKFVSAGLFAVLAILALTVTTMTPSHPDVLYRPDTISTLLLSPRYLLFTVTLASALSALVYFVLAHWLPSTPNKYLILVHFVLLAIGLLIAAEAVMGWASALSYATQAGSTVYIAWHSPIVLIGFTSVALSCAIVLVNLGITAIKCFR
jgi:hypothetical protein